MNTAKAYLRFLRMSPRKVRLLADLVRGHDVDIALSQLKFSDRVASRPVRKLIESAVANATNNHKLDRAALYVQTITVDDGPTYKRWTPRAFGRATPIRKRTSHVAVTLAERTRRRKAAAAMDTGVEAADPVAKKPAARKTRTKKTT